MSRDLIVEVACTRACDVPFVYEAAYVLTGAAEPPVGSAITFEPKFS